MLKTLVKKQLMEIFRSYFYDAKKNQKRSTLSTALFIVFFVLIMVGLLGGIFTFLSITLCDAMTSVGMDWLYFALVCGVVVGIDPCVLSHRENGLKQNAQNDVSHDYVLEYSAESVDGGDALRYAYKHKERRQGVVGYLHDVKRQEALTVRVLHEFASGRILRLRAENLPVEQDPRRD